MRRLFCMLTMSRPEAVLIDGDKNRDKTNARTPRDYSTEARRAGAKSVLKRCGEFAEQGIDAVYCGIGMYADVRAWCRENIENYREIYIKVSMETLYRRNQKGLYSPGMKQVVGVDLPWDEPDCSDVVIENDREEAPAVLVDRLFREFGLEESL